MLGILQLTNSSKSFPVSVYHIAGMVHLEIMMSYLSTWSNIFLPLAMLTEALVE